MKKITIAKGDGIGPEIMDATLKILNAAQVPLEYEEIEIGEKSYLKGNTSGVDQAAWDSIRTNKVFLKAPITTPQGGGYKSLNVTMRKTLGLYANVRPCRSFDPYVRTKHPVMDLVIVRENEEDLYGGIEHQQTDEVVQCLKLISRPGCEKIVRYAFEYAKSYNRKKVTCFTKDNIMKQTDGLFHKVFDEIAAEYPEIESEHWIIDIGSAKVADSPEVFDVIVMPNLYGDVVSDIAAQIAGSVGLAGSSNIGQQCAMFEAIHGSAPDIGGQNKANPSGLINASVMMLAHLGEFESAEKIQNAWLKTIEDGVHTADIYKEGVSKSLVGTDAFADAVVANLGQKPEHMPAVSLEGAKPVRIKDYERPARSEKTLVGVDVFVDWPGTNPDELGEILSKLNTDTVGLNMITNRGVKVWPNGFEETFCTDHWRCRYTTESADQEIGKDQILKVLQNASEQGVDIIKTENLYTFNGTRGFSLGQGQ